MEFIENLGIDFRLLIAQIVNFLILLFVLYKFAYRPIVRLLDKRADTIAQSLDNAQAIEGKLKASQTAYEQKISKAEKNASAILNEARQSAEKLKAQLIDQAKTEVAAIVTKTQAEVASLKEQVITEAKAELGDLVVSATESVLIAKLTEANDLALVKKALHEVKR